MPKPNRILESHATNSPALRRGWRDLRRAFRTLAREYDADEADVAAWIAFAWSEVARREREAKRAAERQ